MTDSSAIDCVGIICFRGDDVLLIRRGTPPRKGEWSIPGGRIEKGETEQDAALRELFEETNIVATLGKKIATLRARFEGVDYILHDYLAEWTCNEPRAGDDAAMACFTPPESVEALAMWSKTTEIIEVARKARAEHKLT